MATLLAKYSFHENYLDSSGNTYDITNSGTAFEIADKKGRAVRITNGDYMDITDSLMAGTTGFCSIVFDFKYQADGDASERILSSETNTDNRELRVHSNTDLSSGLYGKIGDGSVGTLHTQDFTDGVWYHVSIIANSATGDITTRINNQDEQSLSASFTLIQITDTLRIGALSTSSTSNNADISFDNLCIYDGILTEAELTKLQFSRKRMDIWIGSNYKSYGNTLFRCTVVDSINFAAGKFTAEIIDRSLIITNEINYDDSVFVFINGYLRFRGKVEIKDNKRGKILLLQGKDYTSIILERYAINQSFTSKTRKQIMDTLVTDYLGSALGNVAFSSTNIQDLTSEIKGDADNPFIIDNKSVARVMLEFAEQENAQIYVRPVISGDLPIYYVSKTFVSSGILVDYDTQANSTTGHFGYTYGFKEDSKLIKNVFTVYGAASSKLAVSVRNEASIAIYGERHAAPVTEVNATTVALAKARAIEIRTKYSLSLVRGELKIRDHENLIAGELIQITIAAEGYSATEFLIHEVMHSMSPSRANLKVLELIRGSEQLIADQIKKLTEVDFRDADPASTITRFIEHKFDLDIPFTVELVEASSAASVSKIGQMKIGKMKIGDTDSASSSTIFTNQSMIYTTVGKDKVRDLITGEDTTYYDTADGYIAVGTNSTAHTISSTTLGTEDDRKIVTTSDVGTLYEVSWSETFGNVDIANGTIITEIGIFDASSNGTLLAVYSLSSPYTKIDGSDITIKITAPIQAYAGDFTLMNYGRTAFRDLLCDNATPIPLNTTNAHIGISTFAHTIDVSETSLDGAEATGTRGTVDLTTELITSTPAKAIWNFTVGNDEANNTDILISLGMFEASSGNNMLMAKSINAVQKATDNDIIFIITGDMI